MDKNGHLHKYEVSIFIFLKMVAGKQWSYCFGSARPSMETMILTVIPKVHCWFYFQVIKVVSYTSVLVYDARSNIHLWSELCFLCEKTNEKDKTKQAHDKHSAFLSFLFIWVITDLELHTIQKNRIQPKTVPLNLLLYASLGYLCCVYLYLYFIYIYVFWMAWEQGFLGGKLLKFSNLVKLKEKRLCCVTRNLISEMKSNNKISGPQNPGMDAMLNSKGNKLAVLGECFLGRKISRSLQIVYLFTK